MTLVVVVFVVDAVDSFDLVLISASLDFSGIGGGRENLSSIFNDG